MLPPKLPRGVYGVTPEWPDTERLLAAITAAAQGGMRVLQWRRKDGAQAELRAQARAVAQHCRELGVVCLVNDRWRWLLDGDTADDAVAADGVHLGRDDGDLAQVRRALGPDKLIGVSCYNELARARAALAGGADYIAFGAVYPSPTKPQAVHAPLELLRAARGLVAAGAGQPATAQAPRPANRPAVVAIGGITPANAAPIAAAGADAVALISALFEHDDLADISAAAERVLAQFAQFQS